MARIEFDRADPWECNSCDLIGLRDRVITAPPPEHAVMLTDTLAGEFKG
jgi:hypothetical protein